MNNSIESNFLHELYRFNGVVNEKITHGSDSLIMVDFTLSFPKDMTEYRRERSTGIGNSVIVINSEYEFIDSFLFRLPPLPKKEHDENSLNTQIERIIKSSTFPCYNDMNFRLVVEEKAIWPHIEMDVATSEYQPQDILGSLFSLYNQYKNRFYNSEKAIY